MDSISSSNGIECLSRCAFVCWSIWIVRNQLIFKGAKLNPGGVVEGAFKAQSDFIAALPPRVSSQSHLGSSVEVGWSLPRAHCPGTKNEL